jgi:hypothetical protein
MTTEVLKAKTGRYLRGESVPSETRQIQTWLSCTMDKKEIVPPKEKEKIELEIVADIHAYIVSSTFIPEPKPWWKKITASF